MRRPQFSLKTMLWLMVVVAAFLGGFMLGGKTQAMRRECDIGPSFYFNPDGTPAPPGVGTEHLEVEVTPKYPWLQYLPDFDSQHQKTRR